jgi:hypothetical protein
MNKEEAYDAAMLAGLVSSNLNHVQKNMVDSTRPVNKIDMNRFVAPLTGKGRVNADMGNSYEEGVSPLMRKAIEDSMREAMAIPEPVNPNKPDLIPMPEGIQYQIPTPSAQETSTSAQHIAIPAKTQTPASISHEDIQIIKSQLEKINTNLTKMAGMFGKVFASMTTQTVSKNGK